MARTEIALQDGAFSKWGGDITKGFDVDEFSSAFVRFDNGASLIIEVSWLLHHGTENDDVQTWLYGTRAGAHWPKCEIYETNNMLKQHYDRTLKITDEKLRPHYQEIVDFAQAIVDGAPSPLPPEQSLQVQLILEGLYKSQETGTIVELVPRIVPDETIILQIRTEQSRLADDAGDDDDENEDAPPAVITHSLRTTVAVPNGRTVLISGTQQAGADDNQQQMFIMVRATIAE